MTSLADRLLETERACILDALREAEGRVDGAMALLDIPRRTLIRRVNELGIREEWARIREDHRRRRLDAQPATQPKSAPVVAQRRNAKRR